jgi:hypothetical protein
MPSDSDKPQHLDLGSSYSDELSEISGLLKRTQDPTQVEAKLLAFNEKWSNVPPVQIVPGEIWNCRTFVVYGVRFTKKEDAINNLIASGRVISANEEKFVEYLMTWPFYWSPSDPQHNDEPCFQFLRWRFRHLGHLYPIFDNIMWPEDVENIPLTGYVNDPFRMLLAGKDYYYIYNPEDDMMFKAGRTLEEVYEGLKSDKDARGLSENCWEIIEAGAGWKGWWDFPCWSQDREEGRWKLREDILFEPFVPPK